jgi:NitT/TauT family transport system substrate-binding protein
MEALLSGSLDACYTGAAPAITAYVRSPQSLRVIAGAASGGAALIARGVQTPKGLLGMRVAAPQIGNSQDVALRFWLKRQGLPIQESGLSPRAVTVTALANADILGLFQRRQLAAAWVPEPWASRLIHEAGGTLFLDERALWPEGRFPTAVLVASTRALKEREADILALLRAHLALTVRAQAKPAEFSEAVNRAYGALTRHPLKPDVLAEAMQRLDFTTDPLDAALRASAEHAQALGYLPSADIQGLMDLSFLAKLERQGPADGSN